MPTNQLITEEAERAALLLEARIEGDSRYTLRTSARAFAKGAEFALNLARSQQPTQVAQAPAASGGAEGFWLAPMEPDRMMLDAYCNQSGNFQSARSDWNAMRDSWLYRHPAPPSAQPVGDPSDLAGAIAWLKSEEMNAGPRTLKAIATVLASLPAAPVAAPEPVAHGPINCAHDSGVTCGQDGQHCATFIKCSAMGCQRPAAPQPLPPAAQQQAPAGWVMAPREPTEAMELAAEVLKPRGYADLYRAMFAAAPSLGAMGESEHG